MAVKSVLGPFRPGSGGMPPHLAGRESEQSFFRDLLTDLSNGVSPPSEVILYGPRGNGKTVLLRWLEQEAESRPGIEAVRLTPSEISSRTRLAEELLPETLVEPLCAVRGCVGGDRLAAGKGSAAFATGGPGGARREGAAGSASR